MFSVAGYILTQSSNATLIYFDNRVRTGLKST